MKIKFSLLQILSFPRTVEDGEMKRYRYMSITRQSLPCQYYRELLGTALCVFNSNNSFMIENILRIDDAKDWYMLIDKESGRLKTQVADTIGQCGDTGRKAEDLFNKIVNMRNRIIHSFQVTHDGKQMLVTKTLVKDGNKQIVITEEFLIDFIKKNEELSDLLHNIRGW